MKRQDTSFEFFIRVPRGVVCIALGAILVAIGGGAHGAAVVQRGSSAPTPKPAVSRANNAARMPSIIATAQSTATEDIVADTTTVTEPEPMVATAPIPEPEPEAEPIIIENKSSQFSTSLSAEMSSGRAADDNTLAEMVRRQRDAIEAREGSDAVKSAASASLSSGQSACDIGLRQCMKEKCGDDYSKCAGDGDTIWGDKLDACRRNVTCTGHQYAMFVPEIKADRDMNAKLAAYNKIISCGNEYNACIVNECGEKYSKCLGKTAGDAAISKCAKIANNCKQQDSGLASRTMNVFATLRQDAEKQIVNDEKRLYEMRDKMRSQCQRLGALFDDRSLVCVYTVNFFAGNSTTPTASKKLYAGSTFDCTPDWFGIDVTTFKENAYRRTRSQTSASSALLGSGLGQAMGAISSGAINRAIDRKKADDAVKKAENEKKANYGDGDGGDDGGTNSPDNTSDSTTPSPDASEPKKEDPKPEEKKDNPANDPSFVGPPTFDESTASKKPDLTLPDYTKEQGTD